MKTSKQENLCQSYLADQKLHQLCEKVDAEVAIQSQQKGCQHCSGKLHRANYKRKPRGMHKADLDVYRDSFCCDQDGCRKRHTPPSVRFLGRKVYWGFIVVLISAMRHGLKAERVRVLCDMLGVDRRTLERWRQWWVETFEKSSFWNAARARFCPPLDKETLPWSLWNVFRVKSRDRLLKLLEFLSPITTGSLPLKQLL